jgi:hypothetical protein
VPVKKRLGRLARIRLEEAGIRLRQRHAEIVDLHPLPADDRDRLAKVDLCMPRRVRQRHEGLAPAGPAQPHMVLHHRVAARIAMLVAQPLKDPLGRVLLLARRLAVGCQDCVDNR